MRTSSASRSRLPPASTTRPLPAGVVIRLALDGADSRQIAHQQGASVLHPVADLLHGSRLDPGAERPDQEPVVPQGAVVDQPLVHDVVVQDVAQSLQPGSHSLGVAPLEPLVPLSQFSSRCAAVEKKMAASMRG